MNDHKPEITGITRTAFETTSGDHEFTGGTVGGASVVGSEADDDDESKAASVSIPAVPFDRTTFHRHNPPGGRGDDWRSLLIHSRSSVGKTAWALAHLDSPLVVWKKSDLNLFVAGTHRSILFMHPRFLKKMSYDELMGIFCSWIMDYS